VALGAVAAVTSRIKLGTAVCLVAERDPILLAKEVSTLDRLSGGRVPLGIGAGWNPTELQNHGTEPAHRWAVMRERVLAMKRIWTEDEPSFQGTFVRFDPIWQWPKPVQRPHPPILVGGEGPRVLRRVVEYGDEWFPNANGNVENRALLARIAELDDLAAAAGRHRIPLTLFGVAPEPAALERCRAAGVSRCVFSLRPEPAARVLPNLDRLAALAAGFE